MPVAPIRFPARRRPRALDPDRSPLPEVVQALREALAAGRAREAQRLARSARLRAPGDPEVEALAISAGVLARRQRCRRPTPEQIARLRELVAHAPSDPGVVGRLVAALNLRGDVDGAREVLESMPPSTREHHLVRGFEAATLALEGHVARSRQLLRELRERGQATVALLTFEILLAAAEGDYETCRAAFRARCSIEGRKPRSALIRAWLWARWALLYGAVLSGFGFWLQVPWTWLAAIAVLLPAIVLHRSVTRCSCCTIAAALGTVGSVLCLELLRHVPALQEAARWGGLMVAVWAASEGLHRAVGRDARRRPSILRP
jgi:hypothetical protein